MARNAIAGAALVLAACGGAPKAAPHRDASFACNQRAASYTISGHISGDELGVLIDCDGPNGTRILRWKVDKKGTRVEDAHALTSGEFDKLWTKLEGTGWRNLKDCPAGGGKSEPVYTFDLKDDTDKMSFSCQARQLPYPYNDLVDPLDLAASQGRGQLGGDRGGDQ